MLKIKKITVEPTDVYDITVPETSCFFANGILVHNCTEIDLPSVPLQDINDPNGRIALCTLSATNWGNVRSPQDFEKICTLTVRGLDALLSYQGYPVLAAKLATEEYRPLGVGIINFAYFLAKHEVSYSDPRALPLVDEYAEAWSYYLIKASADLAAEIGPCQGHANLKYADGILPIDTRKKEVDELVPHQERMPWDQLRQQILKTGIRNATLMSLMPSECQSLGNELRLESKESITLESLIKDIGKIDIDKIHKMQMIGQRFAFDKPIKLAENITAYECYYNGPKPVTEIEFEDGQIYRFTNDHKLLVNRSGNRVWVKVGDLVETDDIASVNAK